MHETPHEMAWLQRLLDDSYASAGEHLRSIHIAAARLSAERLVAEYDGMRVAVVATVSAGGAPLTGPVDSFLFRGRVHFGTARHAVRTRHLSANPAVSASYVDRGRVVVTVHGTARALDLRGADADFAAVTKAHYGQGWDDWDDLPVAWAIQPTRMFAADMTVHTANQ